MSLIYMYLVLVLTALIPTEIIAPSNSGLAKLTLQYVQVLAATAGILSVSVIVPRLDELLKFNV